MVYLSKLFADYVHLSPNLYVKNNDQSEHVYSVQKTSISSMTHEEWDTPRSVKLGEATRLVLTGSLSDMVLVPSGHDHNIGRKLGHGFNDMDHNYAALQEERVGRGTARDVYLASQYELLQKTKKQLVATNYIELYTKLKNLLTNR